MKEHKVKEDAFTWVPIDKRQSRFGGPMPPRKPELRRPLLWLVRDGLELYLVNLTEEPLHSVTADLGGFQTADDDVATMSSIRPYEYLDVKPNAAVKVEEFDGRYDLDWVFQIRLKIKSAALGHLGITTLPEKGSINEMVLLWNTGESGKNAMIRKYDEAK